MSFDPRAMNTCRITGSTSFVRTDRPLLSVGTSRQPSRIWPSLAIGALDFLLARHPRRGLLRQEHHADAVMARCRQRQALAAARAAQEGVGKLDQDAGAVALQRVGARRAAMGQVLQDRQPLRDDRMGLLALDVGDEAEPARVALVGRDRRVPGAPAANATRSLDPVLHD